MQLGGLESVDAYPGSVRPPALGVFQRSKASPEILPTPLDRALLEALSSIKTKRQS